MCRVPCSSFFSSFSPLFSLLVLVHRPGVRLAHAFPCSPLLLSSAPHSPLPSAGCVACPYFLSACGIGVRGAVRRWGVRGGQCLKAFCCFGAFPEQPSRGSSGADSARLLSVHCQLHSRTHLHTPSPSHLCAPLRTCALQLLAERAAEASAAGLTREAVLARAAAVRHLPPHHLEATNAESAYVLDEIIPAGGAASLDVDRLLKVAALVERLCVEQWSAVVRSLHPQAS
eukprot:364023-Chlamydomonas_euryale.AAC.13